MSGGAPEQGVGRIHVLPDDLANQIAAGEVVERPASVVKELAENALDAGARRVDVAIEGGGIALTRVADDGHGMPEVDLAACVLRHATSKIALLDDLSRIESFGFRGEALPSIASVSRFSIASRARGRGTGAMVEIEAGKESVLSPSGMPEGTVVTVRDLFFNVPARRKFLRALATESAHVTEVVEGIALSRPEVTVTLSRDGRVVREHLRASSREERVKDVLVGWELIRCAQSRGPLTIEAFLSRPEKARLGAGQLRLLVNGRPVKDRALARSVAHAYGSVLDPGRYPVGVVYLDIAPELVDVNVHPQKSEVRFAEARSVQDALYRVIEAGIGAGLSRQVGLGLGGSQPARGAAGDRAQFEFFGSGELPPASTPQAEPAATPYPTRDDAAVLPPAHESGLSREARFVAQIRGMFLLCESDDALIVLDQHAAAERVTYARLKRAFHERQVAMQTLLVPETISVGPSDVALVEEAAETIAAMGLDVRPAGPALLAVYAVPQIVGRASPELLARAMLAEIGRTGGRDFSGTIDLALATMACHGSLRAGESVSREEASELIRELGRIDFAGHCPHGRPILVRIPFRELEHRVGRR